MKRTLLALVLAALAVVPARADEVPIPPAPTRWATDTAGFLSSTTREALDRRLEAFTAASGHQVILWIGTTTGDTPLEDWTVRAFEQWKVGRKGLDDGLILFLFSEDRAARIEVGYGLEERVPDAIAARILNTDILPRLRAGDRDGAVTAGIVSILARVSGDVVDAGDDALAAPRGREERSLSVFEVIFFGALAVGFVILLVTNPSLALYLLFSILSSGGGGGGRGGGGFSGGGGRSGGGGASGRW